MSRNRHGARSPKGRVLLAVAAVFLALAVLCVAPVGAATVDTYYVLNQTTSQVHLTAVAVESTTTEWTTGWYVINSDVTINDRITVTGDVYLILADGKTLNANSGISVTGENSLTIYRQSQGTGALKAVGVERSAGIGGDASYSSGGRITLNGGNIYAQGGYQAAGIGGVTYGYGGEITINDGTVTARGGVFGAGIGGGFLGRGADLTINGGTVIAEGTYYGSGIGGGQHGSGGDVIITGGTVIAKSGGNGANGIGGGEYNGNPQGPGNFTVTGGFVDATSIGNTTYTTAPTTSGIIFNGNDGELYTGDGNSYTLTKSNTVPHKKTLTIDSDKTLDIASGVTLAIEGMISGDGKIEGSGTLDLRSVQDIQTTIQDTVTRQYGVTVTDSQITLNGNTIATSKNNYTATLTSGTGHPSSAVVLIRGTVVSSFYNSETGEVTIPKVNITGNIEIRAKAPEITTGVSYGTGSQTHDAINITDTSIGLVGSSSTDGWYVVSGTINVAERIIVSGDVSLILADGATLTANKGISVTEGNNLTIYAQSAGTGKLNADATDTGYSGIGGDIYSSDDARNAGTITINGGVIVAKGAFRAAGIGGVLGGSGGIITINGGTVTATGGLYGAGIGGGAYGDGGIITITSGTVTATGGGASNNYAGGAGIGGGAGSDGHNQNGGSGGIITITGGTVTATGGDGYSSGAGIGGGGGYGEGTYKGDGGNGGVITINGGTVKAASGTSASTWGRDPKGGAGIGGGGSNNDVSGYGGVITITSGTVTATGNNGGAGIGAGCGVIVGDAGRFSNTGGTVAAYTSGNIYGAPTIIVDTEVPEGQTLTLNEGTILTINESITLTVRDGSAYGSIIQGNGTLKITDGGTFTLDTSFLLLTEEKGTLQITGNSNVIVSGSSTLTGGTVIIEKGSTLTVSAESTLMTTATISGEGKIQNNGAITNMGTITVQGVGNPINNGGSQSGVYQVILEERTGGTISADMYWARSGETVNITITTNSGYSIAEITAVDEDGTAITLSETETEGTLNFTMPNSGVTVKATFVIETKAELKETATVEDNGDGTFKTTITNDTGEVIVEGNTVTIKDETNGITVKIPSTTTPDTSNPSKVVVNVSTEKPVQAIIHDNNPTAPSDAAVEAGVSSVGTEVTISLSNAILDYWPEFERGHNETLVDTMKDVDTAKYTFVSTFVAKGENVTLFNDNITKNGAGVKITFNISKDELTSLLNGLSPDRVTIFHVTKDKTVQLEGVTYEEKNGRYYFTGTGEGFSGYVLAVYTHVEATEPSSSSSSSGSSVWLTETPTPTPTETVTPTDVAPTDIPVTQPTETPASPGFGVLAALAGLGAVAVLRRR